MNVELISIDRTERPRATHRKSSMGWVEIGDNNMYYEQLLELFKQSNLHRSIVLGITDRVSGEGLKVDYPERNPIAWSEINQMFPKSLLDKIALDSTIFDSYALKLTTNKAGTKIVKIQHVPRSYLRPAKADENGYIKEYYYSRNWAEYRKKEYAPEVIECFDFDAPKQVGEFIVVAAPYSPGNEYVNDVTYNGALDWIQADVEIGRYHLSNIQNGFSGLTAVVFKNGEPEGELKRRIESKFKSKFQGASGDKVAFIYQNPGDETMEFKTLSLSDADKQYEVLSREINQRIMFGHRVTSPVLIGIKDDAGLGNNADELAVANETFERLVIRPRQNFLVSLLNDILKWNANVYSVEINQLSLTGDSGITERLNSMSPLVANSVIQSLTINEIRGMAGLPEIEGGDQMRRAIEMSEQKKNDDDRFKVLTDEDQDYLLSYLNDAGEDEADLLGAGFQIVSEEDLEGDDELKIKGTKLQSLELRSEWGLRPDRLSKYDVKHPNGEGIWLVRYQYALARELSPPEIIDTSRKFCKHMIQWKNDSNRVYKREVLEELKNPEFGSYNIFWYKGSYNCRHVWRRKLYFLPTGGTSTDDVRAVGNVPYVVSRLNDKRATNRNNPVR